MIEGRLSSFLRRAAGFVWLPAIPIAWLTLGTFAAVATAAITLACPVDAGSLISQKNSAVELNGCPKGHLSIVIEKRRERGGRSLLLQITPTEQTALRLLATGLEPHDLDKHLGLAIGEAEACCATLFERMGVTNPSEALAQAHRRGLLVTPIQPT